MKIPVSLRLRLHLGEALFLVAAVFSKAANRVVGVPVVRLAADAAEGATMLMLSEPIPGRVRRLRIFNPSGPDQIPKVRAVSGKCVVLDRGVIQAFPKGTEIKVLP